MSRYDSETLEIVARPASPYDWIRWNNEDVENDTVYAVVRGGDEDTVWATRKDALETLFPENAWGGYKMEYVIEECMVVCHTCARDHFDYLVSEGHTVTSHDIYGESTDGYDSDNGLYCECGHEIIEPSCGECQTNVSDLAPGVRYFTSDSSERAFCGDCVAKFRENFRNYDPAETLDNVYHRRYATYVQRGVYFIHELGHRWGVNETYVGHGTLFYNSSSSGDIDWSNVPRIRDFPK